MATINLLPTNLAVKGTFAKVAKLLQTIDTVGFIIFTIVAVGLGGFYIFNSIRLRDLIAREDVIIANIKKMAETETQFVLARDRLDKIKLVLAKDSANKNIKNLGSLVGKVSSFVDVVEVQVAPKKTELTILSKDSSALSNYLAEVLAGGYYKSVKMTNFDFAPNSGYKVTIQGL
jgi:hypothetical protein